MSGIERLRRLASARDEWVLGGTLADIAEQIERERDAEVADSPYDAILPPDERDAIAWVREHGGLDHVRAEWDRRSNLKRTCEKLRAKVERQQRHIEHVQGVCKTRAHRIVELNKTVADMRPRLMPEGMELDGNVLKIWTADNVDYDGETLFVLIGGRDE